MCTALSAGADGGVLELSLIKGSKGINWASLLVGHTTNDPFTASEVEKSLMLERFQAEVHAYTHTHTHTHTHACVHACNSRALPSRGAPPRTQALLLDTRCGAVHST